MSRHATTHIKFTPSSWRKVIDELTREAAALRATEEGNFRRREAHCRAASIERTIIELSYTFAKNPPNYEDTL